MLCLRQTKVSIHAPTGGATAWLVRYNDGSQFQFTRPRGARRGVRTIWTRTPCFNSRAHGGRDRIFRQGAPERGVSIHAPTGGATMDGWETGEWPEFQFTRPRGARRASGGKSGRARLSFNSRAHGGRDRHDTIVSRRGRRFNSRAHGGRDAERSQRLAKEEVSIHAPTGGATRRKSTPRAT